MTSSKFVALAAPAAVLLAAIGPARAASYTITNVGAALPADASGTYASVLNNAGQIAGFFTTGTGASTTVTPYLYNVALGTATTIADPNGSPTSISATGAVTLSTGELYRPVLGVSSVPPAAGALNINRASGVNTAGLVVGSETVTYSTYTTTHPYVYNPATGVTTDLGNTALGDNGGGTSEAAAITTAGHIVGEIGALYSGNTYSTGSAFLATPNAGGYAFTNIGAAIRSGISGASTAYSAATGVNDSDTVIGTYAGAKGQQSFVYANGVAKDLGDFGFTGYLISTPNAINSSGVIVGTSTFAQDVNYNRTDHAFVYMNGTFTDLNSLLPTGTGWVLTSATGINDLGMISGYGTLNGKTTAFLLNPTAVPEPACLGVLIAGGGLAVRRRRA